jgi:uncharacterized protein YggE
MFIFYFFSMKDNLLASIVLGLAIVGGTYWYAQTPTIISTTPIARGTIQVTGDGRAKAVPDTVVLSAGVQVTNATTQQEAINTMTENINQVKDILRNQGIEEQNIQTSNLSASLDYLWDTGKQTPNGYRASESLTIRIEQKEKSVTDNIINNIGKVANIHIDNISYDVTDTTAVYADARQQAIAKARQKADEIASATGLKIKKVQSVSEGSTSRSYPMPMYSNMAMADSVAGTSNGSDISVGQLEYTVSVDVVYEVE